MSEKVEEWNPIGKSVPSEGQLCKVKLEATIDAYFFPEVSEWVTVDKEQKISHIATAWHAIEGEENINELLEKLEKEKKCKAN